MSQALVVREQSESQSSRRSTLGRQRQASAAKSMAAVGASSAGVLRTCALQEVKSAPGDAAIQIPAIEIAALSKGTVVRPPKRDREDWLTLELENWARWAIDRTASGHCRSIEHRYNAGYWGESEGPVPQAQIPFDALRALQMERAIVSLPRAPQPYAGVIKAHYLRRGPVDRALVFVPIGKSMHRMPRRSYFRALGDARIMLKNLLTRGTKLD